jgi:hypothetical protein
MIVAPFASVMCVLPIKVPLLDSHRKGFCFEVNFLSSMGFGFLKGEEGVAVVYSGAMPM